MSYSAINFPNFSDTTGLTFVGNTYVDGTTLVLTDTTSTFQKGACWYNTRINVKKGFETTFQFKIEIPESSAGADGMAFVIQSDPESTQALGMQGEGMGYYHINNGLAVEFDTYRNISWGDENANHIAIQTSNQEYSEIMPSHEVSCIASDTLIPDLKNGQIYTAKIQYDGVNMTVKLNDSLILTAPVNWDTILTPAAAGKAWVGLTGGCGSITENHRILSWTLTEKTGPQILFSTLGKRQNLSLQIGNLSSNKIRALFYLPISQQVSLEVFDAQGRKIGIPFKNILPAGNHQLFFDLPITAAGIYYYQLKSEQGNMVKKMFLHP